MGSSDGSGAQQQPRAGQAGGVVAAATEEAGLLSTRVAL
jgi:hypothetical protein